MTDSTQPSGSTHAFLARNGGLLFAVAAGAAAYAALLGLHLHSGTLRAGTTPATLSWYTLAFAGYIAAIFAVERRRGLPLGLIFAVGIGFRVLLLFTTPTLSDDVYRYMWDGYVANHGVSPYAHPINSPALDRLDTPQRALANNAWMASPYLPAAQYLFAALAWVSPARPLLFQLAMTGIDVLNAALLVGLLRVAGLPGYRLLLYFWNPLVVVEVAHGAHVDAWMILLTLLALWLAAAPRAPGTFALLSPLSLALATLTKPLPLLLLPVLFWRWQFWQLGLYAAAVILLLLPAGLSAGWGLTGPLNGAGLFGAIRIYSEQWIFNSGIFYALEQGLTSIGAGQPNFTAKLIIGAAMLLVLAGVWLKSRRSGHLLAHLRWMAVPLMAYVLLTPTLHPWYLLLLLAFVPFLSPQSAEPRRQWLALPPWLYLSWAAALSYLTYLNPLDFSEVAWVRHVEWWPVLGLLLLWLFRRPAT